MILRKYGIGAYFLLISLIMLLAGFFPNALKLLARYTGNYAQAQATVASVDEKRITDLRIEHTVLVTYTPQGGSPMTAKLDTYTEGMKAGDVVDIVYNADDPAAITLRNNQESQAMMFGGIGFALLIAAIWMLRKRKFKAYGTK